MRLKLKKKKPRNKIAKPRIDRGDRSPLTILTMREGWLLNLRASYNLRHIPKNDKNQTS